MTNTIKFWTPAGNLTQGQAQLLAVPASTKPARDLFDSKLAARLQALVDQSPREAQSALEMSQEHLPELWLIAQNQPSRQWGQSLTSSDSMHSLINQIDWSLPGSLQSQEEMPQSLQGLLENLS